MARHHQPFRVSSLILLFSKVLLVTATCYEIDQNHTGQSVIFTPCNQNTPFSMCLRSQSLGSAPPDIGCLPNGVVLDYSGQFWRDSCTDPTWQSDYCLKAFNACPNVGISFLKHRESEKKVAGGGFTRLIRSWHGIGFKRVRNGDSLLRLWQLDDLVLWRREHSMLR